MERQTEYSPTSYTVRRCYDLINSLSEVEYLLLIAIATSMLDYPCSRRFLLCSLYSLHEVLFLYCICVTSFYVLANRWLVRHVYAWRHINLQG